MDKNVNREELDEIFANEKGNKILVTYPNVGH